MLIKERSFSNDSYRFGFGGQEKDTFYKNGETHDEWIFGMRRDQKK
ncbi:MAG: hypothetical protein HQ490_06475 [Lutibacter sp.]|nr:hypothetical protein [Lutibacter sp.]